MKLTIEEYLTLVEREINAARMCRALGNAATKRDTARAKVVRLAAENARLRAELARDDMDADEAEDTPMPCGLPLELTDHRHGLCAKKHMCNMCKHSNALRCELPCRECKYADHEGPRYCQWKARGRA
jgi:hypothetical protein